MTARTVAFMALGCRVNQAEDNSYRQHSLESGWQLVDFKSPADIYVVNTCAVTLEAERQSRQMIRQAKSRNPAACIVVTGCAGRSLQQNNGIKDLVDLFIPNLHKDNLVSELRQFLGEAEHPQFKYHFPPVAQARTTRLNLKIEDGCFESCSFCIIPSRRGTVRSLPADEVIRRIQVAESLGYQEVVLTGVHLGAYGHEQGQHGLDQLLHRINQETQIASVRLSSLDPHEITDAMIEALAASPRICPYLHLPLQSGSDSILQAMRRRDNQVDMRQTIHKLRQAIPDIALTTDIIVGFPGETEADFADTVQLVEALGFHKIHVFPYSVRPGTRAAFMKNHLPPEVKERRTQAMLALSERLHRQWFERWMGQEVQVLVETINAQGLAKGYTRHYLRVQMAGLRPTDRNTFVSVRLKGYDLETDLMQGEVLVPALI